MPRLVVDCSAFLACVLPDENCPDPVLVALRDAEWVVPPLWLIEVGSSLLGAERRGRIDAPIVARILGSLLDRPLEIEPVLPPGLPEVLELARVHGLTAYDATYLHLALRRGLPLATFDVDLRRAAAALGVRLA